MQTINNKTLDSALLLVANINVILGKHADLQKSDAKLIEFGRRTAKTYDNKTCAAALVELLRQIRG